MGGLDCTIVPIPVVSKRAKLKRAFAWLGTLSAPSLILDKPGRANTPQPTKTRRKQPRGQLTRYKASWCYRTLSCEASAVAWYILQGKRAFTEVACPLRLPTPPALLHSLTSEISTRRGHVSLGRCVNDRLYFLSAEARLWCLASSIVNVDKVSQHFPLCSE